MPWPTGMPPWQQTILQNEAAQNKLSGINPLVIAGIEAEETGGWSGGATNSSGYGGYFGLGENSKYGPYQITPAILNTGGAASPPSQATHDSYIYQSQAAAEVFASLLNANGNNLVAAETAYQNGSYSGTPSAGVSVVESILGNESPGNGAPATVQGANPPTGSGGAGPTTNSGNGSVANGNAVKLQGVAGILQQINDLMNPATPGFVANLTSLGTANIGQILETVFMRGLFAVGFLGIAYVGVKQITGGGGGSNTVVDIIQQNAKNDLAQQRIDATNAQTAQRSQPRVIRREGGYNNNSTVTHVTTPKPAKKPRGPLPKAPGSKAATGASGAATGSVADSAVSLGEDALFV